MTIYTNRHVHTYTYHSNTSFEVLWTFKAYTTAFYKALIWKLYVVKGQEGNLLGKESVELFNSLRVGPPKKVIKRHYHIVNSQRKILS